MNPPPTARGLPLRIALPILALVAVAFGAIMWYLLRPAPSTVAEQGDARIAATPAPGATDSSETVQLPQTGTGTGNGPAGAPADVGSAQSVGGGPPAPVAEALGALRARIERNPKDGEALVQLAAMEYAAGKYDRSAQYYGRAAALDPSNPQTRTAYANSLHFAGRDREALGELHQVLAAHPRFAPALYDQGTIARAMGRRAEAAKAFRQFLRVAPDDPNASQARAALHELGTS